MRVIAALVMFLMFAGGQSAPTQTRAISGTVVDPAGQAIPGVAIELRKASSVLRKTVSDKAGAWKFEGVDPGDYVVRFSLSGFVTTDLQLKVGETPTDGLKVVLKVGAVSETVTVIGGTEVVNSSQRRWSRLPFRQARRGGEGIAAGTTTARGGSRAPPTRMPLVACGPIRSIPYPPADTASYAEIQENRFRAVKDHPLSTFSIDVDTASYANVRRFLNEGRLPPVDAVRIEELINYFRFDYPDPRNGAPVSMTTELGPARGTRNTGWRSWGCVPRRSGRRRHRRGTSPSSSTSRARCRRSTACRSSRRRCACSLTRFAGRPRRDRRLRGRQRPVCCRRPAVRRSTRSRRAIERLSAGGSTNGAAGIQLAYDLASENFIEGGINRVILATDGDFNVGITSQSELTRLIEEKRESRHLPVGPRRRRRQPEGLDDGDAGGQRERQLLVSRLASRRRGAS